MKYSSLGTSGLMVSPVGFGVLTMGATQLNLPLSEGAAVLRHAMESGINFLDTAQYYRTYPYIREALKGTHFDPVIVSKCLYDTYQEMMDAVEEARRELDRDVIEVFLLHELRSGDFERRKGAWEALQEVKSKGIVKAIGVSTHHVDVAEQVAPIDEIDVLFPLINFKGIGVRRGANPGSRDDMATAILDASSRGKGVFAMKIFGGGILTPHYREATDYILGLPGLSSFMVGFGTMEEVDRMIERVEGRLSSSYQPDLTRKKIWIDQGDCEGCGSCVSRCPNNAIFQKETGLATIDYNRCLTCGYCAPVCPVRAIIMLG